MFSTHPVIPDDPSNTQETIPNIFKIYFGIFSEHGNFKLELEALSFI